MLKYQEVAQQIEQRIQIENLEQGTKLPSLTSLVNEYGVSKNTILQTLKLLESKGAVYQVQGSGIFVRRKKRKGYITLLENQGFSGDLTNGDITKKVISISIVKAPKHIAKNLHCTEDDNVHLVKRLQFIGGQLLCLEESYYKTSIVPFLNQSIAEDSIFHYLEKGLNIHVGFSDKYLSVHKAKNEVARYLELPKGSPMLLIEEIYYTTTGEPFDFSRNYYHYEHSQFFLQS